MFSETSAVILSSCTHTRCGEVRSVRRRAAQANQIEGGVRLGEATHPGPSSKRRRGMSGREHCSDLGTVTLSPVKMPQPWSRHTWTEHSQARGSSDSRHPDRGVVIGSPKLRQGRSAPGSTGQSQFHVARQRGGVRQQCSCKGHVSSRARSGLLVVTSENVPNTSVATRVIAIEAL